MVFVNDSATFLLPASPRRGCPYLSRPPACYQKLDIVSTSPYEFLDRMEPPSLPSSMNRLPPTLCTLVNHLDRRTRVGVVVRLPDAIHVLTCAYHRCRPGALAIALTRARAVFDNPNNHPSAYAVGAAVVDTCVILFLACVSLSS